MDAFAAGAPAMAAHDAAVADIAAQVRRFHARQKPFRIYHGSTNSTRTSQRRADNIIDTSGLDGVLGVDAAARTVVVEPNVPMDALVRATLAHGLVAPVVMELPGITVGGGFSGTSGESSSFRYGAFDATVAAIEIVTPEGRVERASKTHQPDLFWGAASAFGTLGVVTLLELPLRPAARYVRLSYALAPTAGDAVRLMRDACARDDVDYVDAIAFAVDATVVCVGRLSDEEPAPGARPPLRLTRARDPWFYLRARDVLGELQRRQKQQQRWRRRQCQQQRQPWWQPWRGWRRRRRPWQPWRRDGDDGDEYGDDGVTDTIPLEDYLFRYDRGGFWVGRYAFRYFLTPFNRVTRLALDGFMRARVMYRALHKSGLGDYYMVQDVGVPYDRVEEFQAWLDTSLGIYPLWLCPLRVRRDGPDAAHGLHAEFGRGDGDGDGAPLDLVNFGVWGPLRRGRGDRRAAVRQNRALEHKVQALGGKKWLYAHAYYTEDEFWAHYDRPAYEAVRARYGAGYLPSVYDKVRVDVEAEEAARARTWRTRMSARVWAAWPLRGLYGVAAATVGAEYLLRRGGAGGEAADEEGEEEKREEGHGGDGRGSG